MKNFARIIGTVLAIMTAGTAAAQSPDIKPVPAMPTPLVQQQSLGAQITYLGSFNGLEGWMVIRTGQPEFYYATPDRKAVVMGLLFDGEGQLITGNQVAELPLPDQTGLAAMVQPNAQQPAAPQPQPVIPPTAPTASAPAATTADVANELVANTPGNRLYMELQGAATSTLGQPTAPALYAFIDPHCPHCQQFLREVEPAVNAGLVSVKILPVAFSPESKKQAAFIMASGDGPQRMLAFAKGDNTALPAEDINTAGVDANVALLRKWNLLATPIIVYRTPGGEVRLVKGRPLDINKVVQEVAR